ncbi:tungsten cofactor oxidoreductase radical SAM maturase [Cellulosilyticum sp. I15G10I2]|uniref:tungsten cofactor oxidoreductase radical SAM maturase n=1 Tax=Cellulosilyticum sp. I15G10I2 TaxID=1892843 RepID=UPI00085C6F88|nr:tungsten cofactor oxidoreductase radical SAM maturase [Cellulosilyticum sp. I15G10I2]
MSVEKVHQLKKVYLELTNRCNLNCTMCYRKTWHQQEMDMAEAILEKCIQQIKSMPTIKEIVLGGIGEPTFSEEVQKVMHALKDYHLTLTTNGTIMHESMRETIADTVNHMIISVDGTPDVFYSIRKFSLEQIIENLKALNEFKQKRKYKTPTVSFQMVLSDMNKDSVFQIIDLAAVHEVSGVIISNVLPMTIEDQKLALYTRYENKEIQALFKKIQNHAFAKTVALQLPAYQLKTERRCRFIEDQATMITVSGDVVPCYRFAHDGTEVVFERHKSVCAYSFGNLSEKPLNEIWGSGRYADFRMTVFNNHYPSCIDCDLADGCDMVRNSEIDCYGNMPSCGDCLWARKLIYCV